MAIATWVELKAAVAVWANRTDLTTQIVDAITLAEAIAFRQLKLRFSEDTATGTTAGATIAIPTGMGRIERLEIESGGVKFTLDYTSPSGIEALTASTDLPSRYTIEDGAIRLISAPNGSYTYTLHYIPDFANLSGSVASNWVLANAPDVYLFGALSQLAIYTNDPEGGARWTPMFTQAMAAVRAVDEARRIPLSGGLQIKTRNAR
jgi:hypothetical protein